MRRNILFLLFVTFLFTPCFLYAEQFKPSALVYYGDEISWPVSGIHDYIIVHPENINTHTHGFKLYKKKVYAYVSIGEAEKNQFYFKELDKNWLIGENKAWQSFVTDVSNKAYQNFMLNNVISKLYEQGFRNFFFDTLDSYNIVAKKRDERLRYENGLIQFITAFKEKFKNSKLILNRGFEIMDRVHQSIDAVLFESYFYGLKGEKLEYSPVDKDSREWLNTKIDKIKNQYKLPIIDVEYLAPDSKIDRKKLVKEIEALGMIPYIGDRDLIYFGFSSKTAVKREILFLYDSSLSGIDLQAAHLYCSLPLEYMGYIPILHDIKDGLPDPDYVKGKYKAVAIWMDGAFKDKDRFQEWIIKNSENGVYSAFLSSFSMDLTVGSLKKLGVNIDFNDNRIGSDVRIVKKSDDIGYEIPVSPRNHEFLFLPENSDYLLEYQLKNGQKDVPAAITPWGGYVLEEACMTDIGGDNIWIINPFSFLKKALRLDEIPVPDPTTENGMRVFFSHIDGDAIMNRAEWNPSLFSGQVILDEILKKYKVPHSVSIVQAETAPYGLYPKLSKKLEKIVRSIYREKNVYPATHTFSHPFKWDKIKNGNLEAKYRLDVKNYKFSIDKELRGSLDYINKFLPENKEKAVTVFWSGNCIPGEKVLEYTYNNDFLNMNGGDTYITKSHPWLSYIAPFGIKKGRFFQIYTGQQNENVYTNEFKGPYWAFKNVIQTFNLTDKPRRFKPIDIYYHFYSGSKKASLKALKKAFDWALKQKINPMPVNNYIKKVMDFYAVSMSEKDKFWKICGLKNIHTLRVVKKNFGSDDVIGFNEYNDMHYLHLSNKEDHIIEEGYKIKEPYLVESNGWVKSFERKDDGFKLSLKSYVPLEAKIILPKGSRVKVKPNPFAIRKTDTKLYIHYKGGKRSNIYVSK